MKFKILLLVNLLTSIIFGQTWETIGTASVNKIIYDDGYIYSTSYSPHVIAKTNILNHEREYFYNEFSSSFDAETNGFCRDAEGNFWISNWYGLFKFDGNNWYEFDNLFENGDAVMKMVVVNGNDKWLLGHFGFYYFTEDSIKKYTFASLGLSEAGQQQYFDVESDGTVWFSLYKDVYKFKDGELIKFDSTNSPITDNYINAIKVVASGDVFIKDGENIVKYKNGEWSTYFEHSSDSPVSMELNIDNNEHTWTYYQGILYEYTGTNFYQYSNPNYDPMISGAHISRSTTFDDENNIFLSLGGKLTKFDGTEWTVYNYPYFGGVNFHIMSNDIIWFSYGVNSSVLGYFNGNDLSIRNPEDEDGIDFDWVDDIESFDGTVYFGTRNGLMIYEGNSFAIYDTSNSNLPYNNITDISFDNNFNMYMIAQGHLVVFDWAEFKTIDFTNYGYSYLNFEFVKVFQNKIYLGTYNTLMILDGDQLTVYDETQIGNDYFDGFNHICFHNDDVWIGTRNNGLFKFDGSSFTHYNKDNSILESNFISDLEVDPNGNIWVGTLDGLIRITNDNWEIFKIENSDLICNDINDVDFNSKGDVYILTSYGISIIKDGINVGVLEEDVIEKPKEFALKQNYPNPFNPTTKISFMVPNYSHVELNVFNNLGEKIATLVNDFKSIGTYTIDFNAENFSLSSGVYFYTLKIGSDFLTKKMIYLK